MKVDVSKLSERRQGLFEKSNQSTLLDICAFPELLAPHFFSKASPVPTLPFDLAPSLEISKNHVDQLLKGYQSIDTVVGLSNALEWLLKEEINITKILHKSFYQEIINFARSLNDQLNSQITKLTTQNSSDWALLLRTIRRFQFQFGLSGLTPSVLTDLINKEREQDTFWLLMIELSQHFSPDVFVKDIIGRDWLNSYYLALKAQLEQVSESIFGDPDKIFEDSINNNDIRVNRFQEQKDQVLDIFHSLSTVFREFEFMKKHPIYTGIIGRLSPAFERLEAICNALEK